MKGKNHSYLNHKVSVLVVLLTLMGLVSVSGGTHAQNLEPPTRGPGQYDTVSGDISARAPLACASYAEPTLAVGLGDALEQAVDNNYGIYDKTDTQIFTEPLSDFFGGGLLPSGFRIGKPQLLYDQSGDPNRYGRFVLVASAFNPATHQSRITLGTTAVSTIPPGTDCTTAFDANRQVNGPPTNYWADEPRVGEDETDLIITAEMKSFADNSPKGAKLWVVPKTSVYNVPGLPCPQTPFHGQPPPVVSAIGTGFQNSDGTRAVAMIPAKNYDVTTSTAYLVSAYPQGGKALNLWTLDTRRLTLSQRSVPTQPYSTPPSAPQPGTSTRIWTGGKIAPTELTNAVYQPGVGLWTVHTIACPAGSGMGSCVRWYQISPTTAAIVQEGNLGFTQAYAYAPAIVVNSSGNVVIPFEASSSSLYVGSYYAGRSRNDPLNTLQSVSYALKAGAGYYQRDGGPDEFGHSINAPGVRSGGDVDPDNDNLFWIYGAYASGLNGTCPNNTPNYDWSTELGLVTFTSKR
jgi:hypothetical protein